MIDAKIKSRRLGYLKVLGKYVAENHSLQSRLFHKRFEDYALLFEKSFSLLTEQSGIIVSNNGKSAEPYVQMAESFEFLIRSDREYLVNEDFRIYALRMKVLNDSNIFVLTLDDIQFFLERLLHFDSEILKPLLLTIINQDEQDDIITIRRKFSSNLASLTNQISIAANVAVSAIGRSKFYIDELFHPRMHWLLDLKLITVDATGKVVLTESGRRTCNDLGLNL